MDHGLDVLETDLMRHDGTVPEDSDLVAQCESVLQIMAD
jgi:hypothetical protein